MVEDTFLARRLTTTTGWRDRAREGPAKLAVADLPPKIEERLRVSIPLWLDSTRHNTLEVGTDDHRMIATLPPPDLRRMWQRNALPEERTRIWAD